LLLLDRARFPRDKLCGDTINPGTVAILRRLGLTGGFEPGALPVDGMIVTGERASASAPPTAAGRKGSPCCGAISTRRWCTAPSRPARGSKKACWCAPR